MKELGYGENYKYAHDHPENFVAAEFLPETLSGKAFYSPGNNQRERAISEFLANHWKGKYPL
jgi:putative ATPase